MTVAVKSWVEKSPVRQWPGSRSGDVNMYRRSGRDKKAVSSRNWVNKVQNATGIVKKAELTTRIEGQGGYRKRYLLEHLSDR